MVREESCLLISLGTTVQFPITSRAEKNVSHLVDSIPGVPPGKIREGRGHGRGGSGPGQDCLGGSKAESGDGLADREVGAAESGLKFCFWEQKEYQEKAKSCKRQS